MLYLITFAVILYLLILHILEKEQSSSKKSNWSTKIFFSLFIAVTCMYFMVQYNMLPNFELLLKIPSVAHIIKGSLIMIPILIIVLSLTPISLKERKDIASTPRTTRTSTSTHSTFADKIVLFLAMLFCTLSYLFYFSCKWVMERFGNIKIDQIIYTITQPIEGTDEGQIISYVFGPLISALFFGLLTVLIYSLTLRIWSQLTKKFTFRLHPVIRVLAVLSASIGILAFGIFGGISKIGFADVKAYFIDKSKIYEQSYVDPKSVQLTFPEKKRNLIYIYAESLESSYLSKDKGGSQEANLLPKLTEMLDQGAINFSNTEQYGGALPTPATGFTVGGLVAQTAGVPVKVSFEAKAANKEGNDANAFGKSVDNFLPGAYSLGEILESQDYNQVFMLGSDIAFAGRDKYFQQHGDYEIIDYNSAKERNWIPNDYKIWWGYEDEKLFERAKSVVSDLATQEQPFNFTLLTADTHFEDGLMTENTPKVFSDQYSNVIHFSDEMIVKFLDWVKDQPYYEDTTIIVTGDHLTMDKDFFEALPDDYQRTVFNLIDNSALDATHTKNREFNTMDLFPTTLASLGVQIEGNRLGLGTNLFSDKKTLMEELGVAEFNLEVSKRSSFYDNKIKVSSVPKND